jgi:hypothetical protein
MKTILTTLIIGAALTLVACGKDKKAATTNEPPASAEPAKTDPNAAPVDPNAEAKPAAPPAAAPTGW